MRIAIVGSGISGLTAAYLLHAKHEVTVFEANDEIGGHTATKTIEVAEKEYAIDTGFIVYNDWTYPNFIRLMAQLGVESAPTDMGFSVFKTDGSFYYAGNNLSTLFAKRSLLFSKTHWQLLLDIVRFNRQSVRDWQSGQLTAEETLGQYLQRHGFSQSFCDHYLVPMGAAIWSSSTENMQLFPVKFFVEFFFNHGLLNIVNRPQWRVIKGGSRTYLAPLTQGFRQNIRVSEPVLSITRGSEYVTIITPKGTFDFDHVVCAGHSDQTLKLLNDASPKEQAVLGSIGYQQNAVTLHTDTRWLPASRRAWASWNYCLREDARQPPVLTYNMNILQGLQSETTFCVTLNAKDKIASDCVLGQYEYAHPVFSESAMKAQSQWAEINQGRTSFCGAYWLNGFHEDGVVSAIRVARGLGVEF